MAMPGSSFTPTPLGHEDNLGVRHHPQPHTIAEELILPAAIEIVETMFGDNFARVAVHIARCKKPQTIAEELILPAAIEIVETMFGDNFAKELQSIPLSNDTVSRRIDDIAKDVEQQLFGKLRNKLFSIQLDEATDSNKDAHFIAYVRFWDASYEWVRDPFQNTPEGFSTTEEKSFIDFTSSGEIKRQFCNKTLFQFWAEVDDEFSELKTKAFRILLPFSTSYLCENGFSAVAALKTKYRSQLNIENELRVSISNIKPLFENLCSARQAHGSHYNNN
ncbi:zinc finger BED domain-containing protein 5 [Trichonephila clavipes]|nr:zinc finger BED domain-containing protein 5 [Trichonephila clavipes]